MNDLSEFLKQEAEECRLSAGRNGSPAGEIFHGMFIMLSSLAERLKPKDSEPTAGPGPQEVGGTHYQEGVKVSPWSLQKEMASSGNAFVDARRADAIKYTFRMKSDLPKLVEDMTKAKHCLQAGIEELERHIANLPKT